MTHDEPEHPLRAGGRALGGALVTELAVAVAALALVLALDGRFGHAPLRFALAHALGLGLAAAAALFVAEAALARLGVAAGLLAGALLAPLVPLAGWYVLELLHDLDVVRCTTAVAEALASASPEEVAVCVGLAVLGYGPAVVLRRGGVGLAPQVAAGAWGLAALAGVCLAWPSTAFVSRFEATSTLAYAALALTRAVALPLGLALGEAAGDAVVAWLRGEERAPAPAPVVPARALAHLALVVPLLGLVALGVGGLPREAPDTTWRRLTASLFDAHELLVRRAQAQPAYVPASSLSGVVGPPPAPGPRAPRPFAAGQGDVALLVVEVRPLLLVAPSALPSRRALAARGALEDMEALVRELERGSRATRDGWAVRWRPTDADRAEARAWRRRVAWACGDAVYGREREALPYPWTVDEVRAAARDGDPAPLVRFLRRRPSRRQPEDDRWIPVGPAARLPAPELWPPTPPAIDAGSSPADGLVIAACAVWSRSDAMARALAMEGLRLDPAHAGASQLLASWHVAAARASPYELWGQLDVAESYLGAPRVHAAPGAVALRAWIDALRAHAARDAGWGRRAAAWLVALEALHPGAPHATSAGPGVARLLAGLDVTLSRDDALAWIVRHLRWEATFARADGAPDDAVAYEATARRLREAAGE